LDEADDRPAVSTLQRLTPHNHHGGLGLTPDKKGTQLVRSHNISPDPGPTPEQTPFFSDFTDAKKFFLYIFFLQLTRRHIIFSLQI
jgi:hypothetical protein